MEGCHQTGGQRVGVRLGAECAIGSHPVDALGDEALPGAEVTGKGLASFLVLVGQLMCQGAQFATVNAVADRVALDKRIAP